MLQLSAEGEAVVGVGLDLLSVADVAELGARIRGAGHGAVSMEEVANSVVGAICELTAPDDGGPSCVLVRCFVTDARSRLPAPLQELVPLQEDDDPDGRCLVLLATEGAEPDWCDRRRSRSHQVIPLAGSAMPDAFRMVSRMFRQFGIPLSALVDADPESFVDPGERAFGLFHVEEAATSRFIPDQDFVVKYGVKSVVAFGGPLPSGDIFSVLIFSGRPIDRHAAELLQPLALSMKLALLPVLERVFVDESAPERPQPSAAARMRVESATLRTLLDVQEKVMAEEYRRIVASSEDEAATGLTKRESQILVLVAKGATNKQVAARLDVSVGTVKWHLYNLFQKLGVETRTEAVAVAQDRGLVS